MCLRGLSYVLLYMSLPIVYPVWIYILSRPHSHPFLGVYRHVHRHHVRALVWAGTWGVVFLHSTSKEPVFWEHKYVNELSFSREAGWGGWPYFKKQHNTELCQCTRTNLLYIFRIDRQLSIITQFPTLSGVFVWVFFYASTNCPQAMPFDIKSLRRDIGNNIPQHV